jgi:hypothetical protein
MSAGWCASQRARPGISCGRLAAPTLCRDRQGRSRVRADGQSWGNISNLPWRRRAGLGRDDRLRRAADGRAGARRVRAPAARGGARGRAPLSALLGMGRRRLAGSVPCLGLASGRMRRGRARLPGSGARAAPAGACGSTSQAGAKKRQLLEACRRCASAHAACLTPRLSPAQLERLAGALAEGAEWTSRITALLRLEGLAAGAAAAGLGGVLPDALRPLRDPLAAQLLDRRSAVARQARGLDTARSRPARHAHVAVMRSVAPAAACTAPGPLAADGELQALRRRVPGPSKHVLQACM